MSQLDKKEQESEDQEQKLISVIKERDGLSLECNELKTKITQKD